MIREKQRFSIFLLDDSFPERKHNDNKSDLSDFSFIINQYTEKQ